MPTYETVFAVPAIFSEDEKNQSIKEIEELIKGSSGNINSSEEMGEKRMAYKVKGHERAYYHLIKFDSPPVAIEEIKKFYRINTSKFIRNMIIKED